MNGGPSPVQRALLKNEMERPVYVAASCVRRYRLAIGAADNLGCTGASRVQERAQVSRENDRAAADLLDGQGAVSNRDVKRRPLNCGDLRDFVDSVGESTVADALRTVDRHGE